MTASLEKSGSSLKASWAPSYTGSVLVEFRAVDHELEWILLPKLTRSLEIRGIPESALSAHTFEMTVCFCDPLTVGSQSSYRVRESRGATWTTNSQEDELTRLFKRDLRLTSPSPAFSMSREYPAATLAVWVDGWSTQSVILPSAVGVEVKDGKMLKVLERGTAIPATKSCSVTTSVDFQTSGRVRVFQGDSRRTEGNTLVDGSTFTGFPPRKQGELHFDLKLTVNASGMATLRIEEQTTGTKWKQHILTQMIHTVLTGGHSKSQTLVVSINRETYTQASVSCSYVEYPPPDRWLVVVTKDPDENLNSRCHFLVDSGHQMHLAIPLAFVAGKKYKVHVKALKKSGNASIMCYRVIGEGVAQFRAELTLDELRRLHQIAVSNCSPHCVTECIWLYRNRWPSYFHEILRSDGIMETYDKDNSGDQASPINGQIKGLFFMAKNENGKPPEQSPFGEYRIQIPSDVLLSMAPNLYFTDFYCMQGKIHYVTLVMTKPGSSADDYCREKLLPLTPHDRQNNPFLFQQGGLWYVNNTFYILVELFYTEDIDVLEMKQEYGAILRTDIRTVGRGRSTPGGKPKNALCSKCNLRPASYSYNRFPTF